MMALTSEVGRGPGFGGLAACEEVTLLTFPWVDFLSE